MMVMMPTGQRSEACLTDPTYSGGLYSISDLALGSLRKRASENVAG